MFAVKQWQRDLWKVFGDLPLYGGGLGTYPAPVVVLFDAALRKEMFTRRTTWKSAESRPLVDASNGRRGAFRPGAKTNAVGKLGSVSSDWASKPREPPLAAK